MPETITHNPNKKNPAFLRYTLISSYFYFCFFLVNTILSPYIRSLGYSMSAVAYTMAAYSLALIIFSPMIGTASDRYGRKLIVQFGFIAFALAMVLYLQGANWFFIVGARVLEAVAVAAILLVALARVEDSVSGKTRGESAGLTFSINYFAKLLAPLVAGFLAERFLVDTPFVAAFCLCLLMAAYMLSIKDHKDSVRAIRAAKNKNKSFSIFNDYAEIKEFLVFRELRAMAILGFVMHAAQVIIIIFLPLFIIDVLGRSFIAVGVALFVYGFMHLAQFYIGRLSDKFGAWRLTIAGCFIVGLASAAIFFINSFFALLIVLFICGLGGAAWNVSAWSLMSDIGERINKEGQIVTCYTSLAKIGAFAMSLLAGIIITIFSIKFLFLLSGIIIIIGVIIALPKLAFAD